MSDIYGKLTEHPEYPVEDSRRFTIEIRIHDYEAKRTRRSALPDPFCTRCGYHNDAAVHRRSN